MELNMNRLRLAWTFVWLLGVAAGVQASVAAGPAADGRHSRVQFRLVAEPDDARGEVVRVSNPEEGAAAELRLEPEVMLNAADIESATVAERDNGRDWVVSIRFTEAGSEKLAKLTGENLGRQLAVVVDGEVVTSPTIRSQIKRSAEITGGANFGQANAQKLAAVMNSAAAGMPATQPAE
jgi:preprotein translocase subunit SecD